MIKEWMEDRDLILLNGDDKCEGTYTWGRFSGEEREQRSAIDMVLMNEKMYERCRGMNIDEGQDIIKFSECTPRNAGGQKR